MINTARIAPVAKLTNLDIDHADAERVSDWNEQSLLGCFDHTVVDKRIHVADRRFVSSA